MKALAKVSIILPTHNRAKYLRQSVESCLKQTYQNIELIVVDDNSQDDTRSIILSCVDQRVKYIKLEKNSGLPTALNKGFSLASGQYLTWTSDDNFYSPEAIECMVNYLRLNKKIDFVYTDFFRINERGDYIGKRKVKSAKWLSVENCIGACFLYTRRVYDEIGGYNPALAYMEDYDYWLRVREKFRMRKINRGFYYYRSHLDNMNCRFKVEEVTDAMCRLRDQCANASEKMYIRARKQFEEGNYQEAKKTLLKCLSINFFILDVLRMLALVYFPVPLILFIRKVKYKLSDHFIHQVPV
jgi:glycosyltransferase involved in cell wall biosynthesis